MEWATLSADNDHKKERINMQTEPTSAPAVEQEHRPLTALTIELVELMVDAVQQEGLDLSMLDCVTACGGAAWALAELALDDDPGLSREECQRDMQRAFLSGLIPAETHTVSSSKR
jgi:hypothetical protein